MNTSPNHTKNCPRLPPDSFAIPPTPWPRAAQPRNLSETFPQAPGAAHSASLPMTLEGCAQRTSCVCMHACTHVHTRTAHRGRRSSCRKRSARCLQPACPLLHLLCCCRCRCLLPSTARCRYCPLLLPAASNCPHLPTTALLLSAAPAACCLPAC